MIEIYDIKQFQFFRNMLEPDRTLKWSAPTHRFDEVGSLRSQRVEIRLKYISPIYRGDQRWGTLTTNQARVVDTGT